MESRALLSRVLLFICPLCSRMTFANRAIPYTASGYYRIRRGVDAIMQKSRRIQRRKREEVEMTKGNMMKRNMMEDGNGPRKWNLEAISPTETALAFVIRALTKPVYEHYETR